MVTWAGSLSERDGVGVTFVDLGSTFVKGKGHMQTCRLVQDDVQVKQTTRKCVYKPQ